MMWIGNKDNALQQLDAIYKQAGVTTQNYLKFCPNIAKIEKDLPIQTPAPQVSTTTGTPVKTPISNAVQPSPTPQQTAPSEVGFSIKDIKLGQEYDGYIKLSYNYGMFVTVK
ncbi:MAG: hypothetical protein WCP92_06485 [bacterium]